MKLSPLQAMVSSCVLLLILFSGSANAQQTTNPSSSKLSPNASSNSLAERVRKLKIDRRPANILRTWESDHLQRSTEETPTTNQPLVDATNELDGLVRQLTLSRWEEVADFLKDLPQEDSAEVYHAILECLRNAHIENRPPNQQQIANNPNYKKYTAVNAFSLSDLFGIIQASRTDFNSSTTEQLAPIVQLSLDQGHSIEALVSQFVQRSKDDDQFPMSRKEIARLFLLVGHPDQSASFLPSVEQALVSEDHDLQLLLVRTLLASDKPSPSDSWDLLQAILEDTNTSEEIEATAITHSLDLLDELPPDQRRSWLEESFREKPDRRMAILSTLGSIVSDSFIRNSDDVELRAGYLQLQNEVVDVLVNELGDQDDAQLAEWEPIATLLAKNWMQEARIGADLGENGAGGPHLHRDRYGNAYFVDHAPNNSRNGPSSAPGQLKPIPLAQLLSSAPDEKWQAILSTSLRPSLLALTAKLHLKTQNEEEAITVIDQLADLQPDTAKQLTEEAMRVWITNHDLNRRNTSPQNYMPYGYQPQSAAIPLTRSQQERNLRELADWLKRVAALSIGPIDESLVAEAFIKSHSIAEVYQVNAIEEVMGQIESLQPETIGKLAQTMRTNLSGVWRDPETQQELKTNRKIDGLEQEVKRGYRVAHEVIERGLNEYPTSWRLLLALAALDHDENDYLRKVNESHNYEQQRRVAFDEFQKAAEGYRNSLNTLKTDEYSSDVYQLWFFAALGSCSIGNINETNQLAPEQISLISAALKALPANVRMQHEEMLANDLTLMLMAVKPNAKFRYLDAGLKIVGNHPLANDAHAAIDYYRDLVTEIQLEAKLDGNDEVGHKQPFGLFVNIRHTVEIERESGGFGKYLQNQNQMTNAYNYGRPTDNYREKFEQSVLTALGEHFEVLSITFQKDSARSMASNDIGWRITPYAYLLLQAKGPQVDKIPTFSLDMDFVDKSGFVVLPIETSIVPIDAKSDRYIPRPTDNIHVVQTLNDNELEEGTVDVEVKVTGHGVLPPVDHLLDLSYPGFVVREINALPVSVLEFDPESAENVVSCERLAMVSLTADDMDSVHDKFYFAKPLSSAKSFETAFRRFDDADIVMTSSEVDLEDIESTLPANVLWILIGLGTAALVIATACYSIARRKPQELILETPKVAPPLAVSPFSTLDYLQSLDQQIDFSDSVRGELRNEIESIEQAYFQRPMNNEKPDLVATIVKWRGRSEADNKRI